MIIVAKPRHTDRKVMSPNAEMAPPNTSHLPVYAVIHEMYMYVYEIVFNV
jgi:hypothetical protein